MTMTRTTRLMLGGATAALVCAILQPSAAQAQSAFQGTPNPVAGTVFITQTQPLDTIAVTSPEAIINWRVPVTGTGSVNFLPQGRTGRFVGFGNFVVLNRILPVVPGPVGSIDIPVSRLIELNGTISSEIDLSNQSGGIFRGGSVWFYSAGGILVGGSAVINVGSLVLTSNDINTTGGLFGPGGEIRFVGTPTSGPVEVSQGAQITATPVLNPGGAYVALVAPRVVQGGTISTDGSTALVAAQAADLSINAGLFDIRVTVGTDDANGVVHTGATGGPLDATAGNQSRVYMVAVPRSAAIEMLLSGTVGYQTMGVAQVDGAVVISAGRDIIGGQVLQQSSGTGLAANVQIGDLISYGNLDVNAEGDVTIASATTACSGCRILDVDGSANFQASNAVRMTVGRGQEVRVTGDLTMRANNDGLGGAVEVVANRGGVGASNAALNAGLIRVNGNFTLNATGRAIPNGPTLGAAQGGTASLLVDGGTVTVDGDILVDASAFASINDATGGAVTVSASGGGQITSGGDMTLFATAESPTDLARAGSIAVSALGGRIATTGAGTLGASVNAFGGNGSAGVISMTAANGPTAGLIEFAGVTALANGTNAGRIELVDTATGAGFALGSLTAQANGAVVPIGGQGLTSGIALRSTDGAILAANGADLETSGGISIDAAGTGGLNAQTGIVRMRANGDITGTHSGGAGPTVRGGGGIDIAAQGLVSFASGTTLVSDGSIAVAGNAGADVDRVDARGAFSITSASGDVSVGNALSGGTTQAQGRFVTIGTARTTGAASDILITASQTTSLGTLDAARNITITAGRLAGTGSSLTAGGLIDATATTDATFGSATGGGGVRVTSGGFILGDTARATGAGANVILSATDFLRMTNVRSDLGAVTMTARTALVDNVFGANAVDVTTTSDLTLTNTQSVGPVTLRSVNGGVSGGTVNAAGAITLTGATTVTATGLTSTGSSIDVSGSSVGVGTANAATTLTLQGTDAVSLSNGTSGGTMTISGTGIVVQNARTTGATADIILNASTLSAALGTASAGRDIRITAPGSIQLFGGQSAGRDVILTGGSLIAGGQTITAARAINATTTGNTSFGIMDGAGGVAVVSGGTITGSTARSAGGPISLSGTNGITVAAVQAAGTTALTATGGAISIGALQSVGTVSAIGRSVQISGNGGLSFTIVTATGGDASITATSGNLSVASGTATGAVNLTALGGNLSTGTLSGAAIALTSNGSATVNGATTATGALSIDAVGNAAINAVATGTSVTVRSGNIAIGSSGRLGTAGTTTALSLTNSDTSSRTYIGGADVTTGYSLSATEMLRLFGSSITVNAPRAATQGGATLGATRPPDVIIGAFTLQGGAATAGNLGPTGIFTIATPGSARVVGAAALESMTAANRFLLSATEAIEVIAGQGSIRMSNGAALSGIIDLRSDDIAVATGAAITAIAGMTDLRAINDRLGESDGVASDEGALAAGGIRMTVRNGVYIQNMGATDRIADRRGFTAGIDGLSITTAGPATRIVINGRIQNAAGGFGTGRDTIPLVAIVNGGPVAGAGQFDQGSTVNSCLIVNPGACFDFDGDSVPPIQDVPLTPDSNGLGDPRQNLLIELRDLEPLPNEPLIDDPVTGTGNDDLWEAPCEPAEGQNACP